MKKSELRQLIRETIGEIESSAPLGNITRPSAEIERELEKASLQIEAVYKNLVAKVRAEYSRQFENIIIHIEKKERLAPAISIQGDSESSIGGLNIEYKSGPYPGRQYRQFLSQKK